VLGARRRRLRHQLDSGPQLRVANGGQEASHAAQCDPDSGPPSPHPRLRVAFGYHGAVLQVAPPTLYRPPTRGRSRWPSGVTGCTMRPQPRMPPFPCVTRGRGLRTAALVLRICRRPRDAAHSDSGGTTGHPRFGGAKCGYGAGRAAESDTESMARRQHPESGT